MSRRPRSGRSYAVEFVVAAIAIVAIWLFLANGGPATLGGPIGDAMHGTASPRVDNPAVSDG